MYFSKEQRPIIKEQNPNATFGELGKGVGERWRALGELQKRPYEDMAAHDKERYRHEKIEYEEMYGKDEEAEKQVDREVEAAVKAATKAAATAAKLAAKALTKAAKETAAKLAQPSKAPSSGDGETGKQGMNGGAGTAGVVGGVPDAPGMVMRSSGGSRLQGSVGMAEGGGAAANPLLSVATATGDTASGTASPPPLVSDGRDPAVATTQQVGGGGGVKRERAGDAKSGGK
jgi:hypothetical protein